MTTAPPDSVLGCPTLLPGQTPGRSQARLREPARVVSAMVCRDGGSIRATPAQARALADALARPAPSPPPGRILCTDHIIADPVSWVLTLRDGSRVTPPAALGCCGRPIPAVQQALNAIVSPGSGAVASGTPAGPGSGAAR